MPENRFHFDLGAGGSNFSGDDFGGGDFGADGFGGGDFSGDGHGGEDFGGDSFGGGGFGGGDFGGDGFGGDQDITKQKQIFSTDTSGVKETGFFRGRASGGVPSHGGSRWRENLPELWGVDLTLILISVIGMAVILLNLPAVLLSIARAIYAVLSLSAAAAIIIVLAAAALAAIFRRMRW